MIKFDFKNCLFPESKLFKESQKLKAYISEIALKPKEYNFPESFINLPSDEAALAVVRKSAQEKVTPEIELIVVVGIGGSSMGAKAIAKALRLKRKLIFIENMDPDAMAESIGEITSVYSRGKKCLFAIATKSGTTLESIANLSLILDLAKKHDDSWRSNFVFITHISSPLGQYGLKENISVLDVPFHISGRFSVFTAIGLFPLEAAGIDTHKLLQGAKNITQRCLSDSEENPAAMGASALWLNNKSILNHFLFSPALREMGEVFSALIAESLGKNGKGLTPLVSIGSSDLHSLGQLYFGGPKDKFTVFVYPSSYESDLRIELLPMAGLGEVKELKLSKAIESVLNGVLISYQKAKLPYYSIDMSQISEESLGELMQMKMIETAYLGRLMGVSVFDQPAVEDYKNEARKILIH